MVSYSNHKDDVLKRLRRIEGQVRGLQRMVEEDTYCIDILTQVSATTRALQSFALQMLDEHMDTCVRTAVAEGGEEGDLKLKEARDAIARLVALLAAPGTPSPHWAAPGSRAYATDPGHAASRPSMLRRLDQLPEHTALSVDLHTGRRAQASCNALQLGEKLGQAEQPEGANPAHHLRRETALALNDDTARRLAEHAALQAATDPDRPGRSPTPRSATVGRDSSSPPNASPPTPPGWTSARLCPRYGTASPPRRSTTRRPSTPDCSPARPACSSRCTPSPPPAPLIRVGDLSTPQPMKAM